MGLDITFMRRKNIVCPKCGEIVGHTTVDSIDAGGRGWYPLLESIGYYVPYEQRTEENDWYGKDMVLTDEQADVRLNASKPDDFYLERTKFVIYNDGTKEQFVASAEKVFGEIFK